MINSPLRYPGGKAKLYEYFTELIKTNKLYDHTYCEPYAGGAGLAVKLLATGFVSSISLNDLDECIYAFWKSVFEKTDELCQLIDATPITIDEWKKQKSIWCAKDTSQTVLLGFSAFYLNRTNRSGIIDGAGPVGGFAQSGKWKIDARYNKARQIDNIRELGQFRDCVEISGLNASKYLEKTLSSKNKFCYLDPPYYVKGSKLYRNYYRHADHVEIMKCMKKYKNSKWIVSYDDVPEIRQIYSEFVPTSYALNYSAGKKARGSEVIYHSNSILPPDVAGFDLEAA